VKPDPHRQLKLLLRLARGVKRSGRRREGNEGRVALCIDLDTTVSLERVAQDTPMLSDRPRVPLRAKAVQKPR
jgi:hypothetical protein